LLQMARPTDREQALQQFLSDAHTPGSPSYHQWLTPEEFGLRFGARDEDTQTVAAWLESQGFTVSRVAKGKSLIEFSGTAGQIRAALHTEIHRYSMQGETHYANASEIKIPAALAPLVGGFSPLNDFYAKPQIEVAGKALYARDTKKTTPLWTLPNQYGTSNPYQFTVAPEDFYTQYDLAPLYKSGVNGSGQTIGIINESNINLSLVQAYQSFFGVTGTLPQVVIDGDDPGDLPNVDVEAYLDVELSGAVAPQATVNLYIAGASSLVDPLELAALRAVDDNQASVLSVSFGQCEVYLGNAGNQFWSSLWEQAAAQGQTVLVSSGDTGPQCNYQTGWVSGLTSTPWNVSVGGTDFYYADYATGGASATSLWNQTNDTNFGSLIAPLPEQPWDDPFGFNVISNSIARGEVFGGGGGSSNCATQNDSASVPCTSGYAKPVWQSGPGVPSDGVRDLPDVSLFASNGANLSAYAICAFAGDCAAGTGNDAAIVLAGGTSASSPAMAGIMALVNQKYGRQGQANYTLYPLAQQKPAAFHDITVGRNSMTCNAQTDPACTLLWNGSDGTSQYVAGPGYDLASGLGSVDASLLVNDWNSLTFRSTTTTLQLSKSSVTHGTPITISTTVAPSSGSGTPTGDVAILTNSTLPSSQSQTFISLSNGSGSAGVNYLPGGSYQVTGRYGGDGSFATSTSTPETLTITPEKSNINFSVVSDYNNVLLITGGTVTYDMPLALMIQPTGVSAKSGTSDGIATGTATFTIDSTTVTVALNAAGIATWTPPVLSIGSHTASATYSGDASFAASASSTPVTFTVTPGDVFLNGYLIGQYTYQLSASGEEIPAYFMNPGGDLTLSVTVEGDSNSSQFPLGTPAPTGTVQICLSTYPGVEDDCKYELVTSQTVPLVPLSGASAQKSVAVATFSNLGPGPDGYYYFNAVYSGDSVWGSGGLMDISPIYIQTLPTYAPSTTVLSITPTSFSSTQSAEVTVKVTGAGNSGTSPIGEIDFYNNNVFLTYYYWYPNQGVAGSTSTLTFAVNPSWFNKTGANQLQAVYWGDQANGPSVSNVLNFTATQTPGDFMLAPQSPQITLQPGASGTVLLNLQSLSSFNGNVAFTCTPSSTDFSCSVNSSVALNGTATATLVIHATEQTAALVQPMRGAPVRWPMAAGMLAFVLFLTGGKARRKLERNLLLSLVLVAAFSVSGCGGGGNSGGGGGGGGGGSTNTPAGTYSVLVTGTANGIVHNIKITVVVP
ncbi:MAG: protease pro-enzyme activation domain-containing protein, partial [Terracidiphilus sp.]